MRTCLMIGALMLALVAMGGPRLETIPDRAEVRNLKASLDLTPAKIAALKAFRDADIDALFPSLTAAQRNFLKIQREITWALLQAEAKEVQ